MAEQEHPEYEAQESAEKVVKYYSYCPRGSECKKGNKTLGGFWTESAAREAIFTHLNRSTYHNMSQRQATDLADSAEITMHEWEEDKESEEELNTNSGGGSSNARAKVRARPTEPDHPPRSKQRSRQRSRSRHRRRPSGSGGGQAAEPSQAVAVVNQQLQDGIAVQTRNAMSFVRAMTRAEKALRLAETVSRRAMASGSKG